MGPKPQKKSPTRSKSPKKQLDNNDSFFNAELNEENWKAFLIFLAPSDEHDELYLEQLERCVKSGSRRKFTWFTRKDIIDLINENVGKKGAIKKQTGPQVAIPQAFLAVMESAKSLMDNKEEIPDHLMAQLIKAKLLYTKACEKEKEIQRANRLNDKKVPQKAGKKDKSPTGRKSPAKAGKKGNNAPLPEIDKQSQLKRKEEIEDEENYIDDEPKDGPHHYIICSGFYSPNIFNYFDEFKIAPDALMKFKSLNYELVRNFIGEIEDREKLETNMKINLKISIDGDTKKPVNVNELSVERQNQLNKVHNELEKFWNEINEILEKADNRSLLQHTARLKYNLKYDPNIKSWFDIDNRTEFVNNIFNELAEKLYHLVIQKRQYGYYINNLKLYSLPSANSVLLRSTPLSTTQSKDENVISFEADTFCDMRYYNELINSVPPEYVSTPIILHCMLEQIVATEEKKPLPSELNNDSPYPQIENLSSNVSSYFSSMVENLAMDEKDRSKLTSILPNTNRPTEIKKASKSSQYLINYNDEIGMRLKGVLEDKTQKKTKKAEKLPFDPIQVETEMLSKSIWTVFTGLPNISPKLAKERAARLQEFLHFCSNTDLSNADVDRALKQFVFETMNLSDVGKKNMIKRCDQNLIIPWDDPYPHISETLSESQQLTLKNLNLLEAKKEKENMKNNRVSSASTSRSLKFQENEQIEESASLSSSSILKSRSSTKMSVQSVHFPDSFDMNQNLTEVVPPKSVDQTVEMINSTKRRDLTDWNFAEHYDPRILVQVLQRVCYTHPYVDKYHNRRDNSLMLAFSNPYDESCLSNHEEWTIKLHSNVGFRNYLEKIYDMIIEWTRDEEAKYQASLVMKEVDKIKLESTDKQNVTNSSPTRPGSQKSSTSDKSKKKAEKVLPVPDESEYITDKFIGHNSLKAWKIENDKLLAENAKDKGKKPKSPNRNRTPSAGSSKSKEKEKEKDKNKDKKTDKINSKSKSPSSKESARSPSPKTKKTSRSNSKTKSSSDHEKSSASSQNFQKANESFVGYDVGNNMIYLKSYLSHMFPSNGALIKTERHVLKSSSKVLVTSSVIKDGHTFSIHLTDPKVNVDEPTSDEAFDETKSGQNIKLKLNDREFEEHKNNIAKSTSFTGVFGDGLCLSYCVDSLKPKLLAKKQLETEYSPRTEISQATQAQQTTVTVESEKEKEKEKGPNKKNSKKGKKDNTSPEPAPNKQIGNKKNEKTEKVDVNKEEKLVLEKASEPVFRLLPWSQFNLSIPTGLTCTFVPETYEGVPATADNQPHRLLVKQSYAIKCNQKASEHFKNFNPVILKEKSRTIKNDGTVIKYMNDNSIIIYNSNGTIYKKELELLLDSEHNENVDLDLTTNSKGKPNKKKEAVKEEQHVPLERKYKAKWTMIQPNGSEFSINKEDKTFELIKSHRIIEAHDSHTRETMITREDNLRVILRPDGSHLSEFEDGTRITSFYVEIEEQNNNKHREKYVKVECPGFASTIFNTTSTECTLLFGNGTLVTCHPLLRTYNLIYHSGEILEIDENGNVTYIPKSTTDNSKSRFVFNQKAEMVLDHEDEDGNKFKVSNVGKNFIYVHNNLKNKKAIKSYKKHSPRFFVIHKDSSGTELLRYDDLSEYFNEVEVDPMSAIIRDSVQGYTSIMGTTILRPLKSCFTDLWLTEYDEKDIIPVGLRCRSLLSFPPNPEIKTPGNSFGTNLGKGLQIEMNFPKRVKNPPFNIPKRMEYRQIIEYQKLNEEIRAKLVLGLKNYIIYISQRAENHRMLLTYDPRTEAEKLTAFKILKLARPDHLSDADVSSLYRNALKRNDDDQIGKNLKSINKLLITNKNKKNVLKEEIGREKKNRYAWKTKFVPSYFQSEWGQAFLELNANNAHKEQFMQTSENEFMNNQISENLMQSERKADDETTRLESRYTNKKLSLPPISIVSNGDKKDDLLSNFKFERYEPNFKHQENLPLNKLPTSIKTSRPNAVPNIPYLAVEEPARRKLHTSIVQASLINGKSLDLRRGIEVYPNEIKFGILREGFTYVTNFALTNVGIDVCRFKVKQPPEDTGLKIVFKPGPIAAGMKRDLTIMLLAIYKNSSEESEQLAPKLRNLKFNLEITTETDLIKLPIQAEIATADEFRNMFRGNLEAGKENHVRLISVRPGNTKDVLTKPINIDKTIDLSREFEIDYDSKEMIQEY